jgi:hypothetical protein
MKSVVALLSLALLLAGCESTMQAEVTQFSGAVPLVAGRNFVVSAEPAQSGSLEFQHYAGLVGGALQDHGFKAAAPGANPDLVVLIHYGSAGSHTELLPDPAWGWGGWGRRHGGPWGPEAESRTYYGQMLEIEIFDGAAWHNNVHTMLYQGRAVGDATVNEISAAVPALVKALFTHFPGNSGQTERVVVPLPVPAGAA